METLWFMLIALMIVVYVVLDGFDLGVGVIHQFVAKTEPERRAIVSAIGPVWDGNEVWLIASGGALYFAFPLLYASSFSGFYLPLMMVLWLLMLRGMGIELAAHVDDELWRTFFNFIFNVSSGLLAIFFGAAIGNVVRGVPLNSEGYFFLPLWTDFRVGPNPGILDWYTILTGILAFVTLTMHGALFTVMKTHGAVRERASRIAAVAWAGLVLLTIASLIATIYVRPGILNNFNAHVWGWLIPIIVAGSLVAIAVFRSQGRELAAFLASTCYIVGMLAGAAFGLYPNMLPSSTDTGLSLTVFNTRTGDYSLKVGLIWWLIGIGLAITYFVFLYRFFWGKVATEGEGYY
jgi:cytochrome bd ubiquinol oxidase subunit II